MLNKVKIMEFKELIDTRHSARNFKADEIPEETLKEIVELASKTPSWENNQPWKIYIATGDSLEKIRKDFVSKNDEGIKGYAEMNPGHRTNYSDRSRKVMEEFLKDTEEFMDDKDNEYFFDLNHKLFNAPAVAYLTLINDYAGYAVYDVGAFGHLLMLAAKDLGVDSIPAYELVKYPDVIKKHTNIPDDEDIIMGIALGYENDDKINEYRAPRLDVDDILTIIK